MINFEVDSHAPNKSIEHDPVLIDALVKLYQKNAPAGLKDYQNGLQAGIRYVLLALNQKISGINS
ncbi:MAG: hypothetical protein RR595_10870 [Lysinibacillus sp.]